MVKASIPVTAWRRHVKSMFGDPTLATLADVERMAAELLTSWKGEK
jgi:hypothetical protein